MPSIVTAPDPTLRLPPHSSESEQALLGGLLLDNRGFDRVHGIIAPSDFYDSAHRLIAEHVFATIGEGKPADVITIAERLERAGRLDDAGGMSYLVNLVANVPSAVNVRRYAEIVRDRSKLRSVLAIAGELGDAAMDIGAGDVDDIVASYAQRLAGLQYRADGEPVPIGTDLGELVSYIDERAANRGKLSGLATGIGKLDGLTQGLEPGQVIVCAARPGMGKTAFALRVAEHVARSGGVVQFHSLEMSRRDLELRLVSQLANVSFEAIRAGTMGDSAYGAVTDALESMRECPLLIDDTPAIRPSYIRARARRVERQRGLALIVVDYLQLMRAEERHSNRTHEVGSISRALKSIAMELHVPIIACAQLNRAVEGRPDRRPQLSDLRDSGEIEQDADIVMMLHREEVYAPSDPQWAGVAELLIRKQRNGPIGTVWLSFDAELMLFTSRDRGPAVAKTPPKKSNGFSAPPAPHWQEIDR